MEKIEIAYHVAAALMAFNVGLLIYNLYQKAKNQTRRGRIWSTRTHLIR